MPQIVGKEVGSIGYGLMGLTWRPKPCSEEQAFKAMKTSIECGCNFWNAGEFYGTPEYNSLHLMEKYFTKYPEDATKVVLSIKGGLTNMRPDGSPEGIRRSVDNCLTLLNGKKKALTYSKWLELTRTLHWKRLSKRWKSNIQAGKIGGIALSEASAATISKAAKITKIVAVEIELSLFTTHIFENGVASVCAANDIPIVAYSPLSRGFLTGELKSADDIPEGDMRRTIPRFQPENFHINLEIVEEVEKLAKQKGCTTPQIAINWVRCQSKKNGNPEIYPIPGATTEERVRENATIVDLSDAEMDEIKTILKRFEVAGTRYAAHMMATVDA